MSTTLCYCPVLATEPEGRLVAIVDFTVNLRAGRLQTSTCGGESIREIGLRSVRNCADESMGGGKILAGLSIRREAERTLLVAH